jgi:hypothetical protein
MNSYPLHALTGMFMTMLASLSNFGKNEAIHTKIISLFGWKGCAIFGLVY